MKTTKEGILMDIVVKKIDKTKGGLRPYNSYPNTKHIKLASGLVIKRTGNLQFKSNILT